MEPILHFSRFEFKYVLNERARLQLESELGYFMALDPYVSKRRHQKYFVRSLYFDDDNYSNYYEKTDGQISRRKYRVRTYTDDRDEDCVIFLEVKGRYNALVYKHRIQLDRSVIGELEQGSDLFMKSMIDRAEESDLLRTFSFDTIRKSLKPKLLVDYERRPYVSKYSPDFRVTFDDCLKSTVTDKLFGSLSDTKRVFLPGYCVVEIKFKHHIPSWFHRLIQSYELRRVSVSKYCTGAERTEIVENLE